MIDIDSIRALDPGIDQAVANAVLVIANSGVVAIQVATNMERILSGPSEEPVEDLANRILEHRKRQYALDEFMNLAQQLKDINDA